MMLSPCLMGGRCWAEEGHSDVKFAAEQRIDQELAQENENFI